MKRRYKYWIGFILLIALTEIALRIFLDNENRPLYQKDVYCEYRLQPNQKITRFHNNYLTNEYGMRSPSLKKTEKKRILLFGDSVLNGGSKIDQADLLSYKLKSDLENKYQIEIGTYNISAASWGPENAFRYFENYVDFDFDLIVLLFSSEDYHDNMHFREVVGEKPAWPDDQPYLALTDMYVGSLAPKIESFFGNSYDYLEGFDDSKINPGWDLFIDYARSNQKEIIVFHHAEIPELKNEKYSPEGLDLSDKLINENIISIEGIQFENEADYLDNIHINSNGHTLIAKLLFDKIVTENLLNLEQ